MPDKPRPLEGASEQALFLAEASKLLAASLDYATTLASVARLAVPHFADWCAVDLIGPDQSLERVAVAHADPARVEMAKRLQHRYPVRPDDLAGVGPVLRTGQPRLVPEIGDEALAQVAHDAEHLRILRELGLRSYLSVPLVARGRTLGAVSFIAAESGRRYGTADLAFAEDLAARAALAVDNARLYREAHEALRLQQEADEQMALLAQASASLTSSLEPSAVLDAILLLSRRLIAAEAYAIWRHGPGPGQWDIVSASGLSEQYLQSASKISDPGAQVPEEPIVVEDVGAAPLLAARQDGYRAEGITSLLAVPLCVHGNTAGTLTFYYRRPHIFPPGEVRVATALANLAASALATAEVYQEQQRLRRHAEEAQRRLAFLAEASRLLASSLDYQATLEQMTCLAVPLLGDWCVVDVVEDNGHIRQAAVAHPDPAWVRLAWDLERRYPTNPAAPEGVAKVIRTGRSEYFPEIPAAVIAAVARDAEHLKILESLGLKSGMIVPLGARGRVLGTISLGTAGSGRRFTPDDLALAEELARRAAVAVDNARLYGEVQAADRRKDEFLATLAHELRNPLAPIRNAVELLRSIGPKDTPPSWAPDVIDRQVRQLVRLVDDLLDVSRITQGKVTLRKEPVDLATVVGLAVETSRPLMSARRQELTLEMPSTLLPLQADPARLAQVVANLLNNAAKYTPEGGRIHLGLETQGQEALLCVRDTGLGIAPELLPRIFDLFTQGDRSLARSEGGLGIGLTLVRTLVEMHGGTVSVRSGGPGKGSEFTVRLPLAPEAAPSPHRAARVDGPAFARRILVVDDSVDNADSLARLLGSCGHDVRTAYDGLAALAVAREFQPEFVFLDIGLPRMDGYEVARRLRAEPGFEAATLVALTGYGQEGDRRQAEEAGFDTHLVKPADLHALRALLANGRPTR
jgi:signal transduction histidine kinase